MLDSHHPQGIRRTVGRIREEEPLARAFRLRTMILQVNTRAAENLPHENVRRSVGRPRAGRS